MKREIVSGVIVAGLLGAAAHAGAATRCTVGVKGGVGIASVGGADADSFGTDSRTGFVGGLFVQADFSENFGVRVEGLYTMKGASFSEYVNAGFISGLAEGTFKLDYIEFPILLVGRIPASESVTFSAFAGPTLGFNIKSEIEVKFLGATASTDIEDVSGFEFGLAFGAGVSFDVASIVVGLDGRYDLGLTTIDDSSDPADAKNRGFSFMAGIGFPIGGSK